MLIQSTHKRLYRWHSQLAFWTSILLLMLCVTAIPVVFKTELQQYVLATSLSSPSTQSVNQDTIAHLANQQLGLAEHEFFVDLPGSDKQTVLWWWDDTQHRYHAYIVNAESQLTAVPEVDAVTTIALAHYEFLIPDPFGEYFVGLVGLATLVIIVIGVLLHVKWRKEKTQFRKHRSFRLWSSDLHKLIGFWLLPYHILVTYTGTILGLGGLLVIMTAFSSFEGDQEAAVATILGTEPELSHQYCDMLSIEQLLQQSEQHWRKRYGKAELSSYDIHFYQDCNSVIGINTAIPGYLLLSNYQSLSMVDGSVVKEIDWIQGSFGERWYALLGPLHFGHFAGYFGRWLYVISAVSLIGLIITGLLLWVDKQQLKPLPRKMDYFYIHPLLKLSVAVTIAIIATSYILLILAKAMPSWFQQLSATTTYLISFFGFSICVYYRPRGLRLFLFLLACLSIILIGVDLSARVDRWLNGVNFSLAVFALIFFAAGFAVKRPEHSPNIIAETHA